MIDIHMLTLPTDRKDWKERMLSTLPAWATVHVIDAKEGPIGPQRLAAFRKGVHPYVSFVDPDDWTEKDAWGSALDALKELQDKGEPYKGVVTREMVYADRGRGFEPLGRSPYKHHFVIVTREFIEEREALFRYDIMDRDIFTSEVKQLDILGYHYRRYPSSGMRERGRRATRNKS